MSKQSFDCVPTPEDEAIRDRGDLLASILDDCNGDMLGRHATLIELNPEYADVARRRIDEARSIFSARPSTTGKG